MNPSRRLVPGRIRVTWYAYLVLTVVGMLTGAATWVVIVLAIGCAAVPLVLVATYGRAGVCELLPGVRALSRSGI